MKKLQFLKTLLVLFGVLIGSVTSQMWADGGIYNCYFTYNDGSDHSQNQDASGMDDKSLGTLSSNLTIKAVYLKLWDNVASYWDDGQLCYTKDNWSHTTSVGNGSWTKTNKDGNNYELQKSSVSWTLASTTDASGQYTLKYYWQAWGSSGGDVYLNNSNNNYQFTYTINPPALDGSDFTVTPSNLVSGTGTYSDPFIIANNSSTTFTISATQAHTDANSALWAKFGDNAYSSTLTSGSYAKSASQTSLTIKAKYYNNSASPKLSGTEVTKTIYYKEQPAGITVAAGSNGTVSIDGTNYGSSKVITPITFSTNYNIYAKGNTHYDFGSWSKTTNGTNTTIGSTTTANTTVSVSSGAVTTVTANFVEHPYTITIVGGTAASTTAKIATTGSATAKAPFGMHFTGWTVPNSNFTLVGCTTSDETITFYATATGTVTANFEQTHAYIEGRFHVTNAARNGTWTNTFSSGNWATDSRNIEFSYDAVNHYYYLHTYAKPSELTSQISDLDPWFFIKSSPSTSNWTGATVNRPHASGDGNQKLTLAGEANKKLADGDNEENSFRFYSSDQSGYVVIGFKEFSNNPYIYYWLEQRLQYDGNGNTSGSAPSGTYGNNTYHTTNASITAPANTYTKTGYSFAGWKKNNAGDLIAAGASVTMSADATLYAQWTENTYNVSVSANSGGSVSPSGTVSVKQVTGTSITATPDDDHAFLNWSISGGGITPTSSSTKTQTFKATTTGGTIAANFQNRWIMKGSGGVFGNWDTDKELPKSATNTYSTTLSLVAGTAYSFKVYDRHANKWYGKTSTTITKNLGELTKTIGLVEGAGSTYDLSFTPAVSGNYTFTYDSSTGDLTIGWPDVNQLQIYTAPGHAAAVGNWDWTSTAGSVSSRTFTLNKNTRYTFKVVYHSDFYGFNNNSDMTIDDNDNWRLYDESVGAGYQNANMYSPVAGSYTFNFNSDYVSGSDHLTVISITYPTAYTITFGAGAINGSNAAISASASPSFSSGDYVLAETDVTFSKGSTKAGYNWAGWYSNNDGTGTLHSSTDGSLSWTATRTGNISVYACYTYKTYTVTLDKQSSAEGWGTNGSVGNQTVTFNTAPTTISSSTLPTAANGYAFMGFYSATGGKGTQFIDASGNWATGVTDTISDSKWILDDGATLYAYYKKAEITNLVITPSTQAPSTSVTATPTISPTPVGDTKICWKLLRNNGNLMSPQPTFTPGVGNAVSFTSPSASGSYKVACVLRTGTECNAGTVLDSVVADLVVAGEHTVTVRYQDGSGRTLAASAEIVARPLEWTTAGDITPPTITGYTFARWDAGDGVSIKNGDSDPVTTTTTSSIQIKAVYDGTLTAVYNKKNMIYFNNTLGWEDVWVYFYTSNKYWDNSYGTGAYKGKEFDYNKQFWDMHYGHMTQIEGTDIWYFDYTAQGWDGWANVAFASMDKANSGTDNTSDNAKAFFSNTTSDPIQVVRRGDHNTSLPMFVPLSGQTGVKRNENRAVYYSDGYWMNYPENTGYTLKIYDAWNATKESAAVREYTFPFSEDQTLPLKLDVEFNNSGSSYWFMVYRNDGLYYGNTSVFDQNHATEQIISSGNNKCKLITSAPGVYTLTLTYHNNGSGTLNYYIDVDFPIATGDYRIVYNDNATWSNDAHDENWYHPSDVIVHIDGEATEAKKDIVSFYIAKGAGITTSMKFQYASAISDAGVITWTDVDGGTIDLSDFSISDAGVYNFHINQPTAGGIEVESVEPYTGNYYIRTNCAGNTKWDSYTTSDHHMTYSDYAEANSGFSHYYCHWVTAGTNVKFVIANDYSVCVSDTLEDDTYTGQSLAANANIRFMYNESTNKISRAYIAGSGNITDRFLVLEGNEKMYDEDGNALTGDYQDHDKWGTKLGTDNQVILHDDENFVYERTIMVKPQARAKLTAKYNSKVQYFRGSEGAFADGTTVQLLGGEASDTKYKMRIVYDFKTNRLVTAYMPGDEISGTVAINADVMLIREHQEAGQQLTFTGEGAKLTDVKTVYGVMKFNRWILNNRANPNDHDKEHSDTDGKITTYHPLLDAGSMKSIAERGLYWISFPFNVYLSDVFGLGTYGTHWIIMEYNGAERAAKGFWKDSEGFWEYIWDRRGVTLEAGKGYVLALELELMEATDRDFWTNEIQEVELFFPSTSSTTGTIKQTSVDVTVPSHECTIDRRTDKTVANWNQDRTIADSHWNIIGVPSYANYNGTLSDGSSTISWNTNPKTQDLPFLYEWNANDNTYTVQSGTTYPFKAMHAYYVQYAGTLRWTLASATPSSIVARRTYAEQPQSAEFKLQLMQNEKMIDQTFVKLSDDEEVSANFAFGEDLNKEFNGGKANIYTLIEGYIPSAGNTLPMSEQTTVIPVGVEIPTAGEYTFAIPEGTSGIGVTLVDNVANTRTNLGLTDYTVNLAAGTHDGRFTLEIPAIVNTPTDVEEVTDEGLPATGVRKVLIDNQLYIIKGDKVFDARGAMVK